MYLLRSNKDMSATAKVNGKIYFHEKYYIISSIKRSIDLNVTNQQAGPASSLLVIKIYPNIFVSLKRMKFYPKKMKFYPNIFVYLKKMKFYPKKVKFYPNIFVYLKKMKFYPKMKFYQKS